MVTQLTGFLFCFFQASITTLTDLLFKEKTKEEEFEDDLFVVEPLIEKELLDKEIASVFKKIVGMIPARVKNVVQSRSYDRISFTSITSGDG